MISFNASLRPFSVLPLSMLFILAACESSEPPNNTVILPPEENEPGDTGENPPDDGENPPDDGENPPDDGENPPDDGENPPGDGENPPDDGEEPVGDTRGFTPPYWTKWVTDGANNEGTLLDGHLVGGMRCSGRYCDDVSLLAVSGGFSHRSHAWTSWFSEESPNERVCPDGQFVTGIRCDKSYCDNIQLRCSHVSDVERQDCYWSGELSEENGGTFVAPEGTYLAGVRCHSSNCDNKQLYLCTTEQSRSEVDLDILAVKFAPRLRFDQDFGTGSGDGKKCFPSDPQAYLDGRARGVSARDLCNLDYGPIQNHEVPTYWMARQLGPSTAIIRYWYFYAWQSTCAGTLGSHAADWESMVVLVVNGELRRVGWYQHGGWYAKEPGSFSVAEGTHPIGFVGKNSHGTYHDAGGSGGCLYFEDYRNPGSRDYRMDTWRNLRRLHRGEGAEPWMLCQGNNCFDGIGHPIEQTGELASISGCSKDGCDKSSLGGSIPFQHVGIREASRAFSFIHSDTVVSVDGDSSAGGMPLIQRVDRGANSQRYILEENRSGGFTARNLNSNRCLTVENSANIGVKATQQDCASTTNQSFRVFESAIDPVGYVVRMLHSDRCVGILDGETSEQAPVVQTNCDVEGSRLRFER